MPENLSEHGHVLFRIHIKKTSQWVEARSGPARKSKELQLLGLEQPMILLWVTVSLR